MADSDTGLRDTLTGAAASYAPDEERPPLASYATLSSVFMSGFVTFLMARRRGEGLPEQIDTRDLVMIGTAGHKLSRLITKEKVGAFIRAPFTELQGPSDAPGEVNERTRGRGLRGAVGQLLTCPFCLDMWIVTAFTAGQVALPRETRLVTSMLSALTLSDFLHVGYRAAAVRSDPPGA